MFSCYFGTFLLLVSSFFFFNLGILYRNNYIFLFFSPSQPPEVWILKKFGGVVVQRVSEGTLNSNPGSATF